EATAHRLAGETIHLLRRHQDQPAVGGIVTVGRVQGSAARAEGAVEPELDRSDDELPVAGGGGPAPLAILAPGFLAAEGCEHAKGKAPALDEPRVRGDGGEIEAGLVRAGEALGEALSDHRLHRLIEALLRGRRHQRSDEVLREIDEDAGGLASLVLHHEPALRIARPARDAGRGDGGPPPPLRVSIPPHHTDALSPPRSYHP